MQSEQVQAAMQQEEAAHKEKMHKLRNEEDLLRAVLEEQERSFIALVTRVTNLRVAKGEYMAAKARGEVKEEKIATGSEAVDRLLELVQQKLQTASGVGSTLLGQLSEAAAEAVTPFCPNSINFKNEKAARITGIALVTRSDLRSVRSWGKRHLGSCPQCAERVARETPRWERYRYDDKNTGLAAAALCAGAPGKGGYRCTVQIVRDRSMRQRAAADERRVDIFRSTVRVHMTGKDGQPLADPRATADAVNVFATKWVDRSLALIREKVATSAPWNVAGTANPDLSAAMAMLLHAILPAVRVTCVSSADVSALYRPVQQRNPEKPSPIPPNTSALDVSLSVSTPVQVASLAPLIELLARPEQRRYLVDHLLGPLASQLGSAIGMAELVSHYVTVALNALDHLHRMAEAHGLLSKDGATGAAPPPAAAPGGQPPLVKRDSVSAKVYGICLSLAVFGSAIEVEAAVPSVMSDAEKAAISSPVERAKVHVLRLAKAFLKNLRTRTPFQLPVLNDPECADVVCRIINAPTAFLEILNRTFSSNERLPSSSRNSALDFVITPKTKLSLALKLYSELCVELYRPFDQQRTAGAVLASANGTSGRPKAPACVPVVDMPVDMVTANAAVSVYSETLNDKLTALENEAQAQTKLEQDGKVMLDKVADALGQSEPYQQWKTDLEGMHLEVKLVSQMSTDVLLPFGVSFVDPRESVEHLLYVRVEGLRTF